MITNTTKKVKRELGCETFFFPAYYMICVDGRIHSFKTLPPTNGLFKVTETLLIPAETLDTTDVVSCPKSL